MPRLKKLEDSIDKTLKEINPKYDLQRIYNSKTVDQFLNQTLITFFKTPVRGFFAGSAFGGLIGMVMGEVDKVIIIIILLKNIGITETNYIG